MFSLVSGVYQAYLAPTQLNILVVGASSSGKTTLLERIKVTQFSSKSSKYPSSRSKDIPNVPTKWLKQSSNTEDAQDDPAGKDGEKKSDPLPPNNNSKSKNKNMVKAIPGNRKGKAKSGWLCPAPSRYGEDATKSDDEEDIVEGVDGGNSATDWGSIPSPNPSRTIRSTTTGSSMESVDLMDNASKALDKIATCCVESNEHNLLEDEHGETSEATDEFPTIHEETASLSSSVPNSVTAAEATMIDEQEYDLKPKAKMLPLGKIRRTIGMNLGKVNIQGAVCNFWDLGGRMHELWERYYVDSDAVIFVWRVPSESEDGPEQSDDESDSRRGPIADAAHQQALLEEVRSSIPDDVPFLVLGHFFSELSPAQKASGPKADVLYSTSRLLPHYHNPYQALFFTNAANGKGVKSAIEWLIPIAKRQLKVRENRPSEGEDGGVSK